MLLKFRSLPAQTFASGFGEPDKHRLSPITISNNQACGAGSSSESTRTRGYLATSELQLGSKLHDAWAADGGRNPTKIGTPQLTVWIREVSFIEDVEDIPS